MRLFRIMIGIWVLVLAVASAGVYSALAQEDCVGELECYEIPGEESSPGITSDDSGDGDSDSGGADEPWSGTLDGRLNPQPDEDFSIYCQNDGVDVWASSVEVAGPMETISLRRIIDMAAGTNFTTEGGMTVQKEGDGDTITLTGSPSNNTTGPGRKSFSQAACVGSNGGEPAAEEAPVEIVQASVEEPAEETATTTEEETTEEEVVVETQDEFLLRVFGTAGSDGASSLEIFWAWVIVLCQPWGLVAMVLPYGYSRWRKGRKQ